MSGIKSGDGEAPLACAEIPTHTHLPASDIGGPALGTEIGCDSRDGTAVISRGPGHWKLPNGRYVARDPPAKNGDVTLNRIPALLGILKARLGDKRAPFQEVAVTAKNLVHVRQLVALRRTIVIAVVVVIVVVIVEIAGTNQSSERNADDLRFGLIIVKDLEAIRLR